MNKDEFQKKYNEYLSFINKNLEDVFDKYHGDKKLQVIEGARYSLLAGGKRIRPVLLLAFDNMLNKTLNNMPNNLPNNIPNNIPNDISNKIPNDMPNIPDEAKYEIVSDPRNFHYALALEMVHTFSLIHDDLPGMDDDSLRRGKPTCHVVYGEGIAILAGDLLLNMAYELLIENRVFADDKKAHKAFEVFSKSIGYQGMIGGQSIDLESEGIIITPDRLRELHSLKTGALLTVPVKIPCILAGVEKDIYEASLSYGENIGLAFQIKDDILDVQSTEEQLGKTTQKDIRDEKNTFVTLLGLDESVKLLNEIIDRAFDDLKYLHEKGYDTEFLESLTLYLLERKY